MKRLIDDIRKNKIPILIIFGLWMILIVFFHNFCPVVLYCGFPCPGCGLTRAFAELVTLHPMEAFRYNPTFPLWLMLILVAVWRRYFRGKSLSVLRIPLLLTAIVTIIVYILRLKYDFPGHPPMNYEEDNLLAAIHPEYSELVKRLIP